MKMKELLKKYAKRYFIDAMSAMALGLFASLLIGTIFNAIGMIPGLSILSKIGKGESKQYFLCLSVHSLKEICYIRFDTFKVFIERIH